MVNVYFMAAIQDRRLNFYAMIFFIIYNPPVYVCMSVILREYTYFILFICFIILTKEHLLYNYIQFV